MATSKPARKKQPLNGFEVTCVVGTVEFDRMGTMTPVEAAMALIGQHERPGQYFFPHEFEGRRWAITVEETWIDPDDPRAVAEELGIDL